MTAAKSTQVKAPAFCRFETNLFQRRRRMTFQSQTLRQGSETIEGKPRSTFKPNQYSILSAYNARSLQSLWKCEELALTCKNYKIRICGIQEQKILIKYSDGIEYQKAGKGLLVLGRSYLNAKNSPHGEIGAFLNERSLKTSRQPSCSGQAI